MRYEAMTGLSTQQIDVVVNRVARCLGTGEVVRGGGRPAALGLRDSIVLVIHLMRRNPVQAVAAEVFNVSQPTVSRRWDLLRPVLAHVLADLIPHPRVLVRGGTALVDGTICPTWDWKVPGGLYAKKAGYPRMNVQIACDLHGELAAIGPVPVPGARHDAHAYAASGLKDLMDGIHTLADLGYVGVEGVELVPLKRDPGRDLHENAKEVNRALSGVRAAVERAVAPQKNPHSGLRIELQGDEIEFDLDPREVTDGQRYEALMGFMVGLGRATGRRVVMTPESASGTTPSFVPLFDLPIGAEQPAYITP